MILSGNLRLPLENVLDLLLDAVCVVDADGRFLFVSAAAESIFGFTPQQMVGRTVLEMVWPADRERTLQAIAEVVAGTHKPNFENRYRRSDGRVVHVMWTAQCSAELGIRVAVARDVTERRRAETMQAALYAISEAAHGAENLDALFRRIHRIIGELLPASNFFVALYDGPQDLLTFPYFVDDQATAPAAGPLASGTLSATVIRSGKALLVSRDPAKLAAARLHPDVGAASIDWLGVPLTSNSGVIGALVVQNHSGQTMYAETDVELLKFVSAQVASAVERKQSETRLLRAAQYDHLTELPNRGLIIDRIGVALAAARRERKVLALLYLDLDRFKQINDAHGHLVGDRLLVEVAQRLTRCVRECDTVGRMAGDEFVVLIGNVHSVGDADPVAEKIRAALCRPFAIAGHELSVAASIGLVYYPEDGADCEQLIGCADEAMYRAKHGGGNRVAKGAATRIPPPVGGSTLQPASASPTRTLTV